jgi:hypothetical protein
MDFHDYVYTFCYNLEGNFHDIWASRYLFRHVIKEYHILQKCTLFRMACLIGSDLFYNKSSHDLIC